MIRLMEHLYDFYLFYPPITENPEPPTEDSDPYMLIKILVGGGFFVVAVLCIVSATLGWKKSRPPTNPVPIEEPPPSPCIDLDSIKILESIGKLTGVSGCIF